MEKECQICVEQGSTFVTCASCDKESCLECVQRWLTISDRTSCQFCGEVWSHAFIVQHLSKSWLKQYKKIVKERCLKRELLTLPETTRTQVYRDTLAGLREEIGQLEYDLTPIHDRTRWEKGILRQILYNPELTPHYSKPLLTEIDYATEIFEPPLPGTFDDLPEDLQDFVEKFEAHFLAGEKPLESNARLCPKESCPGLVMSEEGAKTFECNHCRDVFCVSCYELADEGHRCDEGILASIRMATKDNVQCPGCQTYIEKVYGCFMMWCRRCHTPFDWGSGKKVPYKGFHNPELSEWRAEQSRNRLKDGDEGEQEEMGFDPLTPSEDALNRAIHELREPRILEAYNLYGHLKAQIDLHKTFLQQRNNQDLHILYQLGFIDKEKLAMEAYYRYRLYSRYVEEVILFTKYRENVHPILEMACGPVHIDLKVIMIKLNEHLEWLISSLEDLGERLEMTPYQVYPDYKYRNVKHKWNILSGVETLDNILRSL